MYKIISLVISGIALASANHFTAPNATCEFSADKYSGGWFELASSYDIANTIEKGCECPVAYYSANATNPDNIDVTNSCIRDGQFWKMQGVAYPTDVDGQLNVRLFGGSTKSSQAANYIVTKLWSDEFGDYEYALVGGNKENTWWFLGRSPMWNETVAGEAKAALEDMGYNVTSARVAVHDCIFLGGHDGVNLQKP